MVIDHFRFENKEYVIELQDKVFLVFYRLVSDSFNFFDDPIPTSQITNDIQDPTRLLRLVENKTRQYLYKNKVKYFFLTANDDKRKRLYIHFLKHLPGYDFQVTNDTINVFAIPSV